MSKLKKILAQRDALLAEAETIVTAAAGETREFTPEEIARRAVIDHEVGRLEDDATVAREARKAERKAKAAEARNALGTGNQPTNAPGGNVQVRSEHRTYERGNGLSYLQDLCTMSFGPGAVGARYFQSVERLQRHAQENEVDATEFSARSGSSAIQRYMVRQMIEVKNVREDNKGSREYRALSTSSGSGGEFVPPMYLTEDWLAFARAGRVVADACHKEALPDGTMSINIPKVTGGTSVATQGSQNTNVSDTDLQTAYVTVPVYTKAGMQVVSLQLLERSPIAFDEAVFKDLGLALAQNVDGAVISGSGTNDVTGIVNTAGINTVTWTQASPTIKGFYGQVAQAKADVANARFLPATHMFVTPTRWEWIEQQVDSNGRPLVVPEQNGPWNVLQTAPEDNTAQGLTGGRMQSLDVFQDANIPSDLGSGTNQDLVIAARMDDNWLMESPVVTRALPQTYGNQLSVLLQLYEYIAFTAARYAPSNSVIEGTGLVTPTFNS